MKLLRILGVFLALSLFAGCEVWISFWGDAPADREITVDVTYPTVSPYGTFNVIRARLYQNSGAGYYVVDSANAGSSRSLYVTFDGLAGDSSYIVAVWNDGDADGNIGGSEYGFATDVIDLFLYSNYTVEADTPAEWQQDGSPSVVFP